MLPTIFFSVHKLIIYQSIIEPYFVHSPTILFTLNNAQMKRFQIQQNKIRDL